MLTNTLQESIQESIKLIPDKTGNRYKVSTPFIFGDGDHIKIILKKEGNQWLFSDEGSTYMYLTLRIDEDDLFKGNREKIINNTLLSLNILDRNGELISFVTEESHDEALYRLIQASIQIADIKYLSRDIITSTFREDFQKLIAEIVPQERYIFNWYSEEHDKEQLYPVDCYINGTRKPLFVYALSSEHKVIETAIEIYKFREWGLDFTPVGIFKKQEEVTRKTLKRFTEICNNQFANFPENKEEIKKGLKELTTISNQLMESQSSYIDISGLSHSSAKEFN